MLDMSKAFDTIQRGTLYSDLEEILNPDELNLIHLLLNDVFLAVKLKNETGKTFKSLIGSPQGDAASALFFIIYLAICLKIAYNKIEEERKKHAQVQNEHNYCKTPCSVDFEVDQQFADDISWLTTSKSHIYHVEKAVPKALEERNLFVNKSKTEFYNISRNSSEDWKKCKLVGSKLDSKEDIIENR